MTGDVIGVARVNARVGGDSCGSGGGLLLKIFIFLVLEEVWVCIVGDSERYIGGGESAVSVSMRNLFNLSSSSRRVALRLGSHLEPSELVNEFNRFLCVPLVIWSLFRFCISTSLSTLTRKDLPIINKKQREQGPDGKMMIDNINTIIRIEMVPKDNSDFTVPSAALW